MINYYKKIKQELFNNEISKLAKRIQLIIVI